MRGKEGGIVMKTVRTFVGALMMSMVFSLSMLHAEQVQLELKLSTQDHETSFIIGQPVKLRAALVSLTAIEAHNYNSSVPDPGQPKAKEIPKVNIGDTSIPWYRSVRFSIGRVSQKGELLELVLGSVDWNTRCLRLSKLIRSQISLDTATEQWYVLPGDTQRLLEGRYRITAIYDTTDKIGLDPLVYVGTVGSSPLYVNMKRPGSDADRAVLHLGLGRYYRDMKQWDKAVASVKKMIALDPEIRYGAVIGGHYLLNGHSLLAELYEQKGELEEAIRELEIYKNYYQTLPPNVRSAIEDQLVGPQERILWLQELQERKEKGM